MEQNRVEFTLEMKKDYTILIPNAAPFHFQLTKSLMEAYGYKVDLLDNEGQSVIDEGLKYVHNDTCYPALAVIGQMMDALHSGKYDVNKVALMLYQTGGGCRASNYVHLLRKALINANLSHIPVVSLNYGGIEKNSGFSVTPMFLYKALVGWFYGDFLMLVHNQVRPYELHKGDTVSLVKKWQKKLGEQYMHKNSVSNRNIKTNLEAMAKEFAGIPMNRTPKIKVGIVGELYVKYCAYGNNHLEDFLIQHDCEVTIPGLLGFALYSFNIGIENNKMYGGYHKDMLIGKVAIKWISGFNRMMIEALKKHSCFTPPNEFERTKEIVSGVMGRGVSMGEGWLVPAEMAELIEDGFENIVCTQPFACMPNHISGKGMIRAIKDKYENANIVAIDYDPGATKVNQENRIKLMIEMARERLNGKANVS